jgi:DNA topoisomerase-2
LTEGDSAKALAVSGLSVVGRDNWGVFPLRGKLLNVREASHKQIMENAEINQIKQIMGLQHGKQYTSTESLRYGRLMIMTDQDHDGSHIKGLLINFLDHFWPSLLKVPNFLVEFITPIVKCTKGRQEVAFYTIPEYEAWKRSNDEGHGWTIKYFKGLGTSTAADAKKYFSDLKTHLKQFEVGTDEDRSLIDMAFNKKKADDRKDWLKNFVPGTFMNHARAQIPLRDFINHELILFSQADNIRSLPSIVDGFKPGHRKIMFACFKRKLRSEIKVAQLAGYVAEHSAYHHGEQSLCSTIVGLAQNFVGSNNINLLEPNGQFGTRLQGGKDAASPRYIFTLLSNLSRLIFRSEDDALLKYLNDDGQSIEPEWYTPILPMVLVNGGEGIGTGWSTSIPNYNPADLCEALSLLLDASSADGELEDPDGVKSRLTDRLHPWYRGFTGKVEQIAADKYRATGTWRKVDAETLEITELPLGTWTQSYKEMLEGMLTGGTSSSSSSTAEDGGSAPASHTKNTPPFIKDFREYHTDTTVKFVVTLSPANLAAAEAEGVEKKFKLSTTVSLNNIVCFDALGRIRKYTSPVEILLDFYPLRLAFYQKRKAHLVDALSEDWNRLENKVRFIEEIASGALKIQNKRKADLVKELAAREYKSFDSRESREEFSEVTEEPKSLKAYDYLLNMPISSLTAERAAQMRSERDAKEAALSDLLARSPKDLWRADLQEFLTVWQDLEKETLKRSSTFAVNLVESEAAVKAKKPRKTPTTSNASESTVAAVKPASSSSSFTLDSFLKLSSAAKVAVVGNEGGGEEEEEEEEEEEDLESLPLAERIQRMLKNKETATTLTPATMNSSASASSVAPPSKANSRRTASTKRVVVSESEEESDDAFIVSDDESSYESDSEY